MKHPVVSAMALAVLLAGCSTPPTSEVPVGSAFGVGDGTRVPPTPAGLRTDDIAVCGGVETPTVFQGTGAKGLMKLIYQCHGLSMEGCARGIHVRLPPNEEGESMESVVDGYKIVSKDLDDPLIVAGSSVVVWRHFFPCDEDGRFNAALKAYIQRREGTNQSSQAIAGPPLDGEGRR